MTQHADRLQPPQTTAIGGYDAGRIRELKQQEGDLYVSGSATLVRALLADGLVDELHLYVYPLALGTGVRLFPDGAPRTPLTLVGAESLSNGVAHLTYGPQRAPERRYGAPPGPRLAAGRGWAIE